MSLVSIVYALTSVVMVAALVVVTVLMLKTNKKTQELNLESQAAILLTYQQLLENAGDREERLAQLAVAQDPMTFQALAATQTASSYDEGSNFDPSDDGELARIKERSAVLAEDPVNEYEQSFLAELGIDAEFFESN